MISKEPEGELLRYVGSENAGFEMKYIGFVGTDSIYLASLPLLHPS